MEGHEDRRETRDEVRNRTDTRSGGSVRELGSVGLIGVRPLSRLRRDGKVVRLKSLESQKRRDNIKKKN